MKKCPRHSFDMFFKLPSLQQAFKEKRQLCVLLVKKTKKKLKRFLLLLLCCLRSSVLSRLGESKMPTVTTTTIAWYMLFTQSNNVATSTYIDPLSDSSLGQIQTIGRLNKPRIFWKHKSQYTKFLQIWKVSQAVQLMESIPWINWKEKCAKTKITFCSTGLPNH